MRQDASPFAVRLQRAATARRIRLALEAAVRWVGILLPGLAVLLLLALLLPPTRGWSAVMAGAATLWTVGTCAGVLLPALARPLGVDRYALWLEGTAGLARNELINALQLERDLTQWQGDPVSRALVERSLQRGQETLDGLPLGRLHAGRKLGPPFLRGVAGLLVLLAVGVIAPVRFADATRLFLAAGGRGVIPAVDLAVSPGDLTVERGASVTIQAALSGRRRPHNVDIEMRAPGGEWTRVAMTREAPPASVPASVPVSVPATGAASGEADRYAFLASALKGDLEYRVSARWAASPDYRIRVLEPLQALGYRKLYEPPAYTKLPAQRQVSASADLAALEGTRVTLEVRPRRSGLVGRLLLGPVQSPRELPLGPAGPDALGASWVLDRDESFHVELRDPAEGEVWQSETFGIEVVPDLEPAVRLLSPGPQIMMPPDMRVTLGIDCVDDFGLSELALVYGRAEDDPTRVRLASWNDRKEARVTYTWDLTAITILPGQDLSYYLQVLDNDPLHGPKAGETELFTIRFPTMAEMYASAEQQREEETVSLEEALETQENLSRELKQVAQEMLREDKISWERQQEVQDLLERQDGLNQRVEEIQQSLEASRQRMEMQNLFSMEMIDKVQEIQQLASQIQSEEFQRQMQRMRQALERMDRTELQKAMEQMKISQEEITQALDRTLNMLRQLMAEEKLDRLLQKMEELTIRQEMINEQLALHEQVSDSSAAGDQRDKAEGEQPEGERPDEAQQASDENRPMSPQEAADLAAQQEQLRKELEELREQIEALRKESEQSLKEFAEALKEQTKGGEGQQAQDDMRQAQQAMEQQSRSVALKFGRKAKQNMQAMAAKMSSMKQEIDIEKQMRLARSLYNIANRMVGVSVGQEGLLDQAENLGPRELAVREQELHDEVSVVRDSLAAVARETPVLTQEHLRSVSKVLYEIAEARDQLEAGRRHAAETLAGDSERSLNAAVKSLLEAANQAQSSCASSCSSPFNKMQSLTGQQSDLNEQTRQLMGACDTPRSQMGQGEALMRMAARQEMIRKGMQEVREEIQTSGKAMSELGDAVQEMEDVVRDMRNRRADPRIVERQEQILSRLLSAQRSIRKREESEERLSRPGIDPEGLVSPGPVDMGESRQEALQRAMLRGSQDPVPAEYRGMVERYLRALLGKTR
jgi:hypothetical protein